MSVRYQETNAMRHNHGGKRLCDGRQNHWRGSGRAGYRAAHFDREFTMVLGDTGLGYIINGKSFPATTPLVVRQGERVRIRMINMGNMYHPFHLHGFDFTEIAKDGLPIPEQLQTATNEIDAAPGGSYDVTFTADRPGVWAFHCHILDHVTGPNGEMTGMITVVKVLPR